MLFTHWKEILLSVLPQGHSECLQIRIAHDFILLDRQLLGELLKTHPNADSWLETEWLIHLLLDNFVENVIDVSSIYKLEGRIQICSYHLVVMCCLSCKAKLRVISQLEHLFLLNVILEQTYTSCISAFVKK